MLSVDAVMDTTDCPPDMHRTFKMYPCGTKQYIYHAPIIQRTFRSKKQAWLFYQNSHTSISALQTHDAMPIVEATVEAPAVFHGPTLTDDDLQRVARKYKVDVSVARFYHQLRGKYPERMAHFFDLNYERVFYPCNDIRCCGLEHDDSDIDSVNGDDAAADEVEVEVEVDMTD